MRKLIGLFVVFTALGMSTAFGADLGAKDTVSYTGYSGASKSGFYMSLGIAGASTSVEHKAPVVSVESYTETVKTPYSGVTSTPAYDSGYVYGDHSGQVWQHIEARQGWLDSNGGYHTGTPTIGDLNAGAKTCAANGGSADCGFVTRDDLHLAVVDTKFTEGYVIGNTYYPDHNALPSDKYTVIVATNGDVTVYDKDKLPIRFGGSCNARENPTVCVPTPSCKADANNCHRYTAAGVGSYAGETETTVTKQRAHTDYVKRKLSAMSAMVDARLGYDMVLGAGHWFVGPFVGVGYDAASGDVETGFSYEAGGRLGVIFSGSKVFIEGGYRGLHVAMDDHFDDNASGFLIGGGAEVAVSERMLIGARVNYVTYSGFNDDIGNSVDLDQVIGTGYVKITF